MKVLMKLNKYICSGLIFLTGAILFAQNIELPDVTTVITPGEDVDVLVTERGIAINPRRQDLIDILSKNKALKIVDIETLKEKAYALTGVPQKVKTTDKVVAVIEYRDGSIIDVVKQIEE